MVSSSGGDGAVVVVVVLCGWCWCCMNGWVNEGLCGSGVVVGGDGE